MDCIHTIEPTALIQLGLQLTAELDGYHKYETDDISPTVAALIAKNTPIKLIPSPETIPDCWNRAFNMKEISGFLRDSSCVLAGSGAMWLFREVLRNILPGRGSIYNKKPLDWPILVRPSSASLTHQNTDCEFTLSS